MNWDHVADWVQAVGSVAAIIIAIWTVRQQANRERDNRVIDDAAFASYIRKYLSKDIELKLADIANPDNLFTTGLTIREISDNAVQRYDNEVMKRLEKLKELPLTDWPDIEFANAFNDAYLGMRSDLNRLIANQKTASADADREIEREKQAQRDLARRVDEENERLEEEADEIEGAVDDGRSIMLPPRGQRRRTLERKFWQQAGEEDHWESLEDARARDQSEMADWEKLWTRQEQAFALDTLREVVFTPLTEISAKWRERDQDLCAAIERYIHRAERYHLPTTYEGRANRPKRLAPIFR